MGTDDEWNLHYVNRRNEILYSIRFGLYSKSAFVFKIEKPRTDEIPGYFLWKKKHSEAFYTFNINLKRSFSSFKIACQNQNL